MFGFGQEGSEVAEISEHQVISKQIEDVVGRAYETENVMRLLGEGVELFSNDEFRGIRRGEEDKREFILMARKPGKDWRLTFKSMIGGTEFVPAMDKLDPEYEQKFKDKLADLQSKLELK